ncbi:NUDIX hydrolase [Mycolicibacterium sp.]|uniref:NUDIX hydrolase n=1 Tax=Mycolicibacterium sp. TaxID=2320850 RepID=UPI0028B0D849|nr:NUDIX hydrolase [Mycolicibacterium sp.]
MGTSKKTPAEPISVLAAGAVLWRPGESGEPLIAVIHRPRYDDWSLPKGKIDAGETEPVAAVREIFEETGQRAQLGRHLCRIAYPIPVGTKIVQYWAARACGGEFEPNKEVDKLLWLPAKEAVKRLSYPYDRKVADRFSRKPADTRTVLIVRHATAGRKARYHGDDHKRPLDRKGRAQAKWLVPQLLAFGASTLYAADRSRCVQTIEPLARELDVPIAVEPTLTEEAYAADPEAAQKRILEIAAEADGNPAVCSQGKVIPYLIQWWCDRDGVKPDKSRNRKGSTWVLSLFDGQLIAADHLPSPFARTLGD